MHSHDFNPNSKEYIIYKEGVAKDDLGEFLIELCNHFYEILSDWNLSPPTSLIESQASQTQAETHYVYQCQNCLSIYDKTYGDGAGVAAGVDFEILTDYTCPTCESSKDTFIKIAQGVMSME